MTTTGPGSLLRWTAPDGPWTEPDLHLFPQDGHRYEIVDGSLHVTPPHDEPHEAVIRALVTTLRSAAPEGWWVCARLGIAAGRSSHLIPDVTVLKPRSSGAIWADPADVALVVEVEEGASSRYDRLLKPALYAEAGIAHYWRVSTGPCLHIHTLTDEGYTDERTVKPTDLIRVIEPYPISVHPGSWV